MKKLLLSLTAVVTCLSVSAAVPTLKDQFSGSFNVTQEKPNYSNPSAYDADGNLIITGAFNDTFGSYEAVGTSAYIVKYNKDNSEAWKVGIIGSATITSIDTDADGNIYVAGALADEVTFNTTSGDPVVKAGMKDFGEYITSQNAGFIAKYDSTGKLLAVESYLPTVIPSINDVTAANPDAMYFGGSDIKCYIYKIKVDGSRLYVGASVSGKLVIGSETFEGTYINMFGYVQDIASEVVFSLDSNLSDCKKAVNISVAGPLEGFDAPGISDATFTVNNGAVYASFVVSGTGKVNYTCDTFTDKVELTGTEQDYIFFSGDSKCVLKQAVPSSSAPANRVNNMFVNDGTLYVVGSAVETIPALELSENAVKTVGVSDIFVAAFNTSSMDLTSIIANAHDEGTSEIKKSDDTTEEKPDYEMVASSAIIDNVLYINTEEYNFNQAFLSVASYWFDGSSFSAAPVNATGVATVKDMLALVSSDAAKVDYKTYTYSYGQSGIADIDAEFDENAPVEYYNLQGIRVTNPENGLYIRRQGSKVQKVIL